MSIPKVHLYVRVRMPDGSRPYLEPVFAGNQKLKEGWAIYKDQPQCFDEAIYYLRYRLPGKDREWKRLTSDWQQALTAKRQLESSLRDGTKGLKPVAVPKSAQAPTGRDISTAVKDYLEEKELAGKKPRTLAGYSVSLQYFQESLDHFAGSHPKPCLDGIDRLYMLRFSKYLRDVKESGPRTVHSRFKNVMSFLKAQGVHTDVKPGDWPTFTEGDPEIYEQADLDKLFAVCNTQERLLFEFFLMTGMREQEVMHTYWSDLDLTGIPTVRVTPKAVYRWDPKAYKGREIPIPERLAESLRAAKVNATPGCPLLFPTDEGTPNGEFLALLKKRAKDAGLNPDDFWLHRFRSTFSTWHLWTNGDVRSVNRWLGHSDKDMTATMRYLRPARGKRAQQMVNLTFGSGVAA